MSLCMQLLLWWGGDENRRQLPVIVCAVVSVFCLVLSPVYAHRSCIPYVVLCTMIAVFAFDEALAGGNGMLSRWVIPAAVLIFAILAVGQMGYIYSSYEANRYADEYNRHRLSAYDGENKTICLLKYENDVGRGMAPYDEGFEYIDPWMHEYYDIPGDVAMVWYTQDELMDRLE